jgi:hypothetical protein
MEPLYIKDLIQGSKNGAYISVGSLSIPMLTLKELKREGYERLKVYEQNKTLAIWGKSRSACFTEDKLHEKNT